MPRDKVTLVDPIEAYDLWSSEYDDQPGNLMLDLDELIFSHFLDSIDIKSKIVYDIGCGTGRHWKKIMDQQPGKLVGFEDRKSVV